MKAKWTARAMESAHRHFLLKLQPESAHELATGLLGAAIQLAGVRRVMEWIQSSWPSTSPLQSQLGLAAGFDKNAEWISVLPAFGFGFAEVGTVTPRPQAGNPRPRLFRFKDQQSLFNQMGFNNDGMEKVGQRLEKARPSFPKGFQCWVNLGKNFDTPLDQAARDYALGAQRLAPWADALVVNVSSPNTPGLRDLQTVDHLSPILEGVLSAASQRGIPCYVKLGPEVRLQNIIGKLESRFPIQGWIVTNTLGGEWKDASGQLRKGGWSGRLVQDHSRQALVDLRKLTQRRVISVGGVDSASEFRWRLEHGADAVQVYTAWMYGGPSWVQKLLN